MDGSNHQQADGAGQAEPVAQAAAVEAAAGGPGAAAPAGTATAVDPVAKTSAVALEIAPAAAKVAKNNNNNNNNGSGDDNSDEEKAKPVSLLQLFKFADTKDWLLMLLGAIGGCGTGVALPLFSLILGNLYTDFGTAQGDEAIEAGAKYARLFGYVGVAAFVTGSLQVACFTLTSERQTLRIRKRYLSSILRQEVAWFDATKSGELTAKVAENTVVIREAMGEKLGALFQFLAMFLGGFIIGFVENWKLTLIIVAAAPLLAGGGFMMMKVMADSVNGTLNAYSKAGGVAEEAFAMIRTVASLGVESQVKQRYEKNLADAEAYGIRKARAQGLGMGMTMGVYFLCYALAFWFGAKLVIDSEDEAASRIGPNNEGFCLVGGQVLAPQDYMGCGFTEPVTFATPADVCRCITCQCGCIADGTDCVAGGDILTVFFAVVMGAFALGQAAPSLSALTNGRAAAGKIYSIIDRTPAIADTGGSKVDNLQGHIQLRDVKFRYPSRPDQLIFDGLNLDIPAGQTIALVGGSGCGKSTITQLVQRFYDPEGGSVTVDGKDLRDLQLTWLRNNIGLVGQEPVLFATSIAKNISYGAVHGTKPTRQQVEAAARAANAYNFISELPQGFETFVGERGSSMSGGQKQRVAIARAIIRDPSILILDEATSALDNESERIVQKALDDLLLQKKRTTLVIAHRLSTVRNADKIVVLGGGGVLEEGSHDELIAKPNGHYAALVAAAQRSQESGGDGDDLVELINHDPELHQRMGSSQLQESTRSRSASRGVSAVKGESSGPADSLSAAAKPTDAIVAADDDKKGKKKKKKEKEKLYKVPIRRIFQYSKPEGLWYIPAVLAAAVNGATMPVFAILFAEISTVYFNPTSAEIKDDANKFALYFVIFAVIVSIANGLQFSLFGYVGEKMTKRVRASLFHALLRQEVGFYDDPKNSVGALSSKLSTDAAMVKANIADSMSLLTMNLVTVIAGLIIAFVRGWELTLVLLALLPLIVIGGAMQMLAMAGIAGEDDKAMSEAGQVLSESISGIRTVTAFGLRESVVALYDEYLAGPSRLGAIKGVTSGLGFGFSQGIIFAVYSVAFYYGGKLIADGRYNFLEVINVFFAVVMMGFGMGQSAAMAPDIAKGGIAVSSVFSVIDRVTKVDPEAKDGKMGDSAQGDDIELKNVAFTYPSRPDAKILKDFSLKIKSGSTVALVGQSGSGKSTCIQLLERFYDPDEGNVLFRGVSTKEANPRWIRSQLGLVSQEPQLFGTTIFENIAYGVPQDPANPVPVTQEQVEEAAKNANAHDFIMTFPDGYQTEVGENGSQLSGGQKQRICLARCLIRKPRVLLLDEATSALDNESERIVQETLDRLMAEESKTTKIVIAHRLSTIQNADVIAVVDHGVIVEQGTHSELLAKNGVYAKLTRSQGEH